MHSSDIEQCMPDRHDFGRGNEERLFLQRSRQRRPAIRQLPGGSNTVDGKPVRNALFLFVCGCGGSFQHSVIDHFDLHHFSYAFAISFRLGKVPGGGYEPEKSRGESLCFFFLRKLPLMRDGERRAKST